MVCGLHIFQRFIWKPIQYQLHIIVKREARLDQIYKTDLNETSFFRIRGKEKNWKKKRKLLKLRLRGFETLKSMEYMNDRISTYYLFPFKKKCTSLLKRIVISQVYLIALIAVFYWGFVLMYHPTNYSGVSIAVLYIQCVCACAASMFFMGILCFTATNLLRNIGIGIGCVFLLWLFLTSSITRILPQLLQLFKLSGEVVQDGFLTPYWPSRILYAVVAIGLLFLNLYLVNKQPDYNKKGWCKHGNKGK